MTDLLRYDEDTAFTLGDDAATVNRVARTASDDRLRATRFGEWTAKELIGHLADAAEAFAERVHRCVEEESPFLPSFDQDVLAAERRNNERDAVELARRLAAAHGAIVALLQRPGAAERPGRHAEHGPVTAGWLAAYQAKHSREHVTELAAAFPPRS